MSKLLAATFLAIILGIVALIFYAGYEALVSMQPPQLKRWCECPGQPRLEKFE